MGLRIKSNISSLTAQRRLGDSTQRLSGNMERLASGFRINRSSDDAAGLAISDNLRANVRSLKQAQRNANDGISLVQVAEGSMNEISNILVRLRELATQSSSDTLSNAEREFTNKEYVQLVDEIDRISNSSEFNGVKLLQGADNNDGLEILEFHIGAGDGTMENRDRIGVDVDELQLTSAEVLGLGKEAEIGPSSPGGDFDRNDASAKLTVIDEALRKVSEKRATLGSTQSRLNSAVSNLAIQVENVSAAKSRIKDVDYAAETAEFTQNRILQQSGASVLTQANSAPEIALSLLR